MTVIVGLLCSDGLVIASDSQEGDEDLKRLDVKKVYDTGHFGFKDAEVIVAGTGASAHIARVAELIGENGFASYPKTPRNVADIVEDSMGQMKARYGDDLDLELILGVYCNSCPREGERPVPSIALYSVYPAEEDEKVGVAELVTDYAATGSGGLVARYLLNRLHDESRPTTGLKVEEAIREAVYVIEEVKKVDPYCGGPIQLIYIEKPTDGSTFRLLSKKSEEISSIVGELSLADSDVKNRQRQIFPRVCNSRDEKPSRGTPRKRLGAK
jgi:20S proteasome alpha/beta subunit